MCRKGGGYAEPTDQVYKVKSAFEFVALKSHSLQNTHLASNSNHPFQIRQAASGGLSKAFFA